MKRPPGITPPPPPPPVDPPAPAGRPARGKAKKQAPASPATEGRSKPAGSRAPIDVRDAETAPIDPLPASARSSRSGAGPSVPLASPRATQTPPPARPPRRTDAAPWWTTPERDANDPTPSASSPADANPTVPVGKKSRSKPDRAADANATVPLGRKSRSKADSPTGASATIPSGTTSAARTEDTALTRTQGHNRAQSTLRTAVKERRRYEKAEARRFTQRSRRRRMAWLISGASVAALVVVVLLAAYSPLLAVRTVAVEGLTRLDPTTVTTALDDQLGRPLALVDYGAIERDLAQFPYIESYSVEARPPDTLAVRIVERRPVAQVQNDAGFNLIDAAGVTVQQSPERIPGFPVLDLTGTEIGSAGFRAAAAVLMSLPDALIAQVDRIAGTTPDSVTMVFTGAGQRVVWGDADDSALKARILERLIATQDPSLPVEYDVSSPQSPVIR
ncbi:FtsQ-type POTRA domain-containing protein [Herbiconiux sp. UC225_62]|uniref:FtsQ-type POTRA domain-containing protein n=1 Tax=Herbiconiux sp. UC225_62 TaxID=3350168 RepID=UPI0036D33FFE